MSMLPEYRMLQPDDAIERQSSWAILTDALYSEAQMKWLMTHIRLAKLEKELRSNPTKDVDSFKKIIKV